MIRGLAFSGVVWLIVSCCIMIFSHLSKSEKVSLIKAVWFGLVVTSITMCIISVIVLVF